jgi:hypothetical protein
MRVVVGFQRLIDTLRLGGKLSTLSIQVHLRRFKMLILFLEFHEVVRFGLDLRIDGLLRSLILL